MGKRNGTTKLEHGSVYKKNSNGTYYYRYQINGQRKSKSLKTKNLEEAVKKAKILMPIVASDSVDVIAAHVKHAKGLEGSRKELFLAQAWDEYSSKPDRATPATVAEQNSYKATWNDFVNFVNDASATLRRITPEMAQDYAKHLRNQEIAVDTHNRKIRRLEKIFNVLHEYHDGQNPFSAPSLRRKEREEQGHNIRRMSFSQEEEAEILRVLDDPKYKVMHKHEIRVVYYIGMFTGQRFKDCVLLRWDQVDFNRKRIWVKQFKTGKEVTIPIAPRLLMVLKEAKEWKENQYVCPKVAERYNKTDKNGKNVGNNLVNIDALRVIKWIGLEPSVKVPGRKKKVTVYGFHSLRHSFVSHCAEAGVPKAVVLSIIGTNSEIVDKHYTHIGDEAQERAINQLFGSDVNSISDRERIEKALKYINSLPESEKTKHLKEIESILKNKITNIY